MLSSTFALGLLFVLFVDTIVHPSPENPVIADAKQLRIFGPPGVLFNLAKSKHAASDSTNPSSWPKDNVKRALNSTGMRNISSLDELRSAPVNNSSDLVEATKSTLVVDEIHKPTCYRYRRAAPIANPSHCNHAIYELESAGDPEEAVLWRGQETWNWLTCKVELIPRTEYSEYMTRSHLAQVAALIMQDCVTSEHGYRGGHMAVGSRLLFRLKVWASTSSVIVNETTSAVLHLLDSPDLMEAGADSTS